MILPGHGLGTRMLVESGQDAHTLDMELRSVIRHGVPLAIDTETTGLHLYQGDVIRGISFAWRNAPDGPLHSAYLPISHPESINFAWVAETFIVPLLNEHQGLQVFHHAIFDWAALSQLHNYHVPTGRFYDTQVASWLIDENAQHGLKEQGALYFGEDAKEEKRALASLMKGRTRAEVYRELRADPAWKARPAQDARIESARIAEASVKGWADLTARDIWEYACKDTELTLRLMEAQTGWKGEGRGEEFQAALDREHRVQGVLYRMVRRGIRLDAVEARTQYLRASHALEDLERKFAGLNLDSTPQLQEYVYEKLGAKPKHFTRKGAPSTARAALEELEGIPEVRDLLEFRRLRKAISAYYRPLQERRGNDGRVHAAFSSTRTVTGRLSCSDPNLMTVPRGDTLGGVRDLFIPAEGYELWEYDLGQAELRVMASYCQDPTLVAALLRGDDLHNITAEMVFGPDFTPLQRRLAKNLNFGFSYGIGPRKFATYMVAGTPNPVTQCGYWDWSRFDGVPRPRSCGSCHVCQAATILDNYRRAYPKLVKLMKGLEKIVKAEGILDLHVPGRYRHFKSPGKTVPAYTALNAIVQGGVAELMKDVMLAVEPVLADLGAHLCLQVHDSLVIEVPPGLGEKVGQVLQEILDEINPFDLPMVFDASRWEDHA